MTDIVERLLEWQQDPLFTDEFAADVGFAADELKRLRRIELAAQEVVLTQKLWGGHHDAERRSALRQLAAVVPPAVSRPQDICTWCEGSGTVATGIMEACSTQCRKCDGTGLKPA